MKPLFVAHTVSGLHRAGCRAGGWFGDEGALPPQLQAQADNCSMFQAACAAMSLRAMLVLEDQFTVALKRSGKHPVGQAEVSLSLLLFLGVFLEIV